MKTRHIFQSTDSLTAGLIQLTGVNDKGQVSEETREDAIGYCRVFNVAPENENCIRTYMYVDEMYIYSENLSATI